MSERAAPARPAYDDLCLDPFRELPPRTWSRALHAANGLVDAAVDRACRDVLTAVGVDAAAPLATARTASGTVPERAFALEWIVERARRANDVAGTGQAPALELGTTLELVAAAADFYPSFLRGEADGRAFFRRADVLALWEGYFAPENLVYAVTNDLAAHAAAQVVDGRDASRLRVLELGGGLGSAARALLERVAPWVDAYVFTDCMPIFLRRGFERLEARFTGVGLECARLDFDRPFARQGFEPGSFDVVFAVNALHAAHDLGAALRQARDVLVPGGVLVLGEAVRPAREEPLAIEFVFQLADDFHDVVLDPRTRPNGGFLWHGDWLAGLAAAGFERARALPDPDAAGRAYPGYSLGAFVAHRP